MKRDPSSLWAGVIGLCATLCLLGHNSELNERVSHTPLHSWGTEAALVSVCGSGTVVSRECGDGNA